MRTSIPWGDGSGDYIHLDYDASAGDQTVLVSSDANSGVFERSKVVTFSASGASPVSLTVTQKEAYNLIVPIYNGVYPAYGNVARGFLWVVPDGYKRLTGVHFDGDVFYDTGMRLYGSDTLRFAFSATKSCNVLGCYTSASAQTNYSLYVSTSSSAKYTRYNGGTYNSYIQTNKLYEVELSPTGTKGMQTNSTWTEKTFTTESTLLIGSTSVGATSAKLTGDFVGDFEIENRAYWVPYQKISDNSVVYINVMDGTVITNLGSGTPTPLGYA